MKRSSGMTNIWWGLAFHHDRHTPSHGRCHGCFASFADALTLMPRPVSASPVAQQTCVHLPSRCPSGMSPNNGQSTQRSGCSGVSRAWFFFRFMPKKFLVGISGKNRVLWWWAFRWRNPARSDLICAVEKTGLWKWPPSQENAGRRFRKMEWSELKRCPRFRQRSPIGVGGRPAASVDGRSLAKLLGYQAVDFLLDDVGHVFHLAFCKVGEEVTASDAATVTGVHLREVAILGEVATL